MINEIKTIVQNYLANAKLCHLTTGVFTNGDVRITDKLLIPSELVRGDLKKFAKNGDKVSVIRNQGGQECYILEILDRELVTKGSRIRLRLEGSSGSQVYEVLEVLQ